MGLLLGSHAQREDQEGDWYQGGERAVGLERACWGRGGCWHSSLSRVLRGTLQHCQSFLMVTINQKSGCA